MQCIDTEYVCDGKGSASNNLYYIYGCEDESDEDDKLCCVVNGLGDITKPLICDGNYDCYDKSDEFFDVCKTWNCSEGMWKCKDFKCIDLTEVCDGITQCNDASDEQACETWHCHKGWRKCRDGHQCIPDEAVCDGDASCMDRSDEDDEFCIEYNCLPNFRKCANRWQCIKDIHICDSEYHCLDISDELCDSNCLQGHVGAEKSIIKKCEDDPGVCIPVDQYCDGVADCPDASDEAKSDCSCEGWGLISHDNKGLMLCLYPEWCPVDGSDKKLLVCSAKFNHVELIKHQISRNILGK